MQKQNGRCFYQRIACILDRCGYMFKSDVYISSPSPQSGLFIYTIIWAHPLFWNQNILGTFHKLKLNFNILPLWRHFKASRGVSFMFLYWIRSPEVFDFCIFNYKHIFLVLDQNFISLIWAHPKMLWNACNFKPWFIATYWSKLATTGKWNMLKGIRHRLRSCQFYMILSHQYVLI